MPRLVGPDEAAAGVSDRLEKSWPRRICDRLEGIAEEPISVPLRPGVRESAQVERIGNGAWTAWRIEWSRIEADLPGVTCLADRISIARVEEQAPLTLVVDSLAAGCAFLARRGGALTIDAERAWRIALRLRDAGAVVGPRTVKEVVSLTDPDVEVVVGAVDWLRRHPDISGYTSRQLPLPGAHSKWTARHGRLLGELTGRDLAAELRPRLVVVHVTYVDPEYLRSGGRRHDSWTTGDRHDLAYEPTTVVVVENRDCRLWFPELVGAVVVEGGGSAATASLVTTPALAAADWVSRVEHLVYWGDIDSRGFEILASFRAALAERGQRVRSVLMDARAVRRYAEFGVDRDPDGGLLRPSRTRPAGLTPGESEAFALVATAGEVAFRRIEQERIPHEDARDAVLSITGASR